ncbi:unnamed protein product [Paramecium octaurelia]|uniref:Uncharacterized protein n=1 Tax=Paramecium octaurelia TaxID=43137 RepID=A0A8S1VXG7_PAROT|nr:unnamed protein product [Paramecium octaurelia]
MPAKLETIFNYLKIEGDSLIQQNIKYEMNQLAKFMFECQFYLVEREMFKNNYY